MLSHEPDPRGRSNPGLGGLSISRAQSCYTTSCRASFIGTRQRVWPVTVAVQKHLCSLGHAKRSMTVLISSGRVPEMKNPQHTFLIVLQLRTSSSRCKKQSREDCHSTSDLSGIYQSDRIPILQGSGTRQHTQHSLGMCDQRQVFFEQTSPRFVSLCPLAISGLCGTETPSFVSARRGFHIRHQSQRRKTSTTKRNQI